MRSKYLLCLLLILVSYSYAQELDDNFTEDENEIIDSLLNEDGLDDLLELARLKSDFIAISFDYNNDTYFSGRDIGIDQFNSTPQITYLNSSGFFANISSMYYEKFQPKWDFVSVTVGYGDRFGKNNQFRWFAFYDRYFYSDPDSNPFKNAVNTGIEIENKSRTLGTDITMSYLFGSEGSIQFVSTSYGEIKLLEKGNNQFKLRPELRITVGQQTIQLARTFTFRDREITVYEENNDFGLVNTQLYIPFQYSLNNFDLEFGYVFNIPSALEGESNLSSNSNFAVSISYLFGL
ncbi:hypothetical protein [Tenacibaculum sp. MAR_2009_124]|uniref:hypothetical protein n=1 Tax=Tenacibaculum sp. MAR_2009_124 TaxID=1250059 RepID=UPI00115F98B7|nr:hypothetical protein [Tenacibaculum sp. MAR_2009_124]